jgi:MoaA/NifB/PqqE/SkfB family radical SAM enzyme
MKCSAFWKHTNVRAGNRIYACCRFKNPIDNFDGDLENILYSDAYKMLREKAQAGEFIPGCEKCAYEESIGHKSLRQEFNEKYDFDEVRLDFLEIGFDNLCNLTCDGCNSEFSTSWIAKEEKIYGTAKNKLMEIDEITIVPESINKVLFLGGEPLITEKHYHLIKKLKDNTEIIYNTNATFIPKDYIIKEFKRHQTHFIISIDGYDKLNESVRSGTKWNQVLNFIKWCQENNFSFEFNTVLHMNNIHGMIDLYNFIKPYDCFWYVNVLTHPKLLDINNLPYKTLCNFLKSIENLEFPNKQFIKNHIDKNQ